MQDLDKTAMGGRIRRIRQEAGLRQWELARLLGTTQSAVHKYEHGVVPEPRRLVELARIGGTSIEWILTGRHWENGSEEQLRLSPELLETACALRKLEGQQRAALDEALRICGEAVRVVTGPPESNPQEKPRAVPEYAGETLRLLESASRIQGAVLRWVIARAADRITSHLPFSMPGSGEGDPNPAR